ncbi:hypothetical protein ZIOFF_051325 [Zingiber officinale]|uniref:Uncharacterized protein n=1 Tax=Zingiber officinale TaxID=94328 RepID=A0A8J5FMJ2_ZINOF|nr:hypothetical protein ZIOFF_051325 [Zingiber officinale]
MSSECSSGCQSGWTIYLVHSSDDQSALSHKHGGGCFRPEVEEEEEEEDLSMVSDASSWPPHFDGAGYCCVFSAPVPTDDGGEKGGAAGEQQPQIQHAVLEDTASSQLCSNTNKAGILSLSTFARSLNLFLIILFASCYQSKRPMEELLDSSSCDLSTTQSKVHLNLSFYYEPFLFSVSIHNIGRVLQAKPTSTTPRQGSRKQRRKEYSEARRDLFSVLSAPCSDSSLPTPDPQTFSLLLWRQGVNWRENPPDVSGEGLQEHTPLKFLCQAGGISASGYASDTETKGANLKHHKIRMMASSPSFKQCARAIRAIILLALVLAAEHMTLTPSYLNCCYIYVGMYAVCLLHSVGSWPEEGAHGKPPLAVDVYRSIDKDAIVAEEAVKHPLRHRLIVSPGVPWVVQRHVEAAAVARSDILGLWHPFFPICSSGQTSVH